jgi:apolipoprotein N-acyltransferase
MKGSFTKKISSGLQRPLGLAILAAAATVLAFPSVCWSPLVILCPLFLTLLVNRVAFEPIKVAFGYGFLTGYLMILGGGYWIAYVVHEFGYLPWVVSVGIFLAACGFEAFNIPVFITLAAFIHKKLGVDRAPSPWKELWYALALPSLFVITEYLTPKLFPWYLGHTLFNHPILLQITEITGSVFLSFLIYSFGSVAALELMARTNHGATPKRWVWGIPLTLLSITLLFGAFRLSAPEKDSVPFRALLIQANIGSFDKVKAEKGDLGKIQTVIRRYERLTDEAMSRGTKPQLIIWPEAAIPAFIDDSNNFFVREIKNKVLQWNTPLITGSFGQNPKNPPLEFNAAYLLVPQPDDTVSTDVYYKNVLLAFGEYMPLGDAFPSLYTYFPTVSHFASGEAQKKFNIAGQDFGITICYEAVLPSFFRKVVSKDVQAVINLTNDSWFGPTNEPLFHASMTVFRAVENRVPFLRVANTGLSFFVDDRGRIHNMTGTFEEGFVDVDVSLPSKPPKTFYAIYGDWFVALSLVLLVGLSAALFNAQRRSRSASQSSPRTQTKPRRKTA